MNLVHAIALGVKARRGYTRFLVDLIEDRNHGLLDRLVLHGRDPQG
jgi:hypothetical protein